MDRKKVIDVVGYSLFLAAALGAMALCGRYACINDRLERERAAKQEEQEKKPKATLFFNHEGIPLYADFQGIPVKVEKMHFIGNGTLDLYKGNLLARLHQVRFNDIKLDRYIRSINSSLIGDTSFVQPGKEYAGFVPLQGSLDGLTNGLIAKGMDELSLR